MNWQLRDAKSRLSALVNAAQAGEPQTITRRGRPAVVVVDAEAYARLAAGAGGGFVDHLLAMPAGGDEGGGDPFARPRVEARAFEP